MVQRDAKNDDEDFCWPERFAFSLIFGPKEDKKKKKKAPLSPFGGERNQPKNAKKKERNFCSIRGLSQKKNSYM